MEIKTKFNIDDKVWGMHDNTPKEFTIFSISVNVQKGNREQFRIFISYRLILESKEYNLGESLLFASKAELLASL